MTRPAALSEDAARTLLTAAAETIEVAPAGPLARRTSSLSRRALTVPASAAAVVLLTAGLLVVRAHHGPVSAPAPAAPTTRAATSIDRSRDFRLGFDQIPSMLGQTEASASAALRAMGAVVSTSPVASCAPAGTPVSTAPHTGTIVHPGDRVAIRISSPDVPPCGDSADPRAYALVQYAVSGGPAPATAPGVDLAPAAAALRRWAASVDRFRDGRLTYAGPTLTSQVFDEAPSLSRACRSAKTAGPGRWLAVRIAVPTVTSRTGILPLRPPSCRAVVVRLSAGGSIAGIRIFDRGYAPPVQGMPDVLQDSVAGATRRLEDFGYRVKAVGSPNCGPVGLVTYTTPPENEPVVPPGVVTLYWTSSYGPCDEDPFAPGAQ